MEEIEEMKEFDMQEYQDDQLDYLEWDWSIYEGY
jgi:hypothetical protein